jgi:hypothetical protein
LRITRFMGLTPRIVEIVGSLVRLVAVRMSALVLVVAALSGCGSDERALKLPAVKEALHAAGLGSLHVLTQQGGYDELRSKGFTEFTSGPVPDGPDYLQGRARPELMIVRFGRVSEAAKTVPRSRTEGSEGLTIEVSRACNVAVMNSAPQRAAGRAVAAQVLEQLRKRCT